MASWRTQKWRSELQEHSEKAVRDMQSSPSITLTYLTRVNCLWLHRKCLLAFWAAAWFCSVDWSVQMNLLRGSTSVLGPPPRQPWVKTLRLMQAGEHSLSSPTPATAWLGPAPRRSITPTKKFCSAGKHLPFASSLQCRCSARADMIWKRDRC